MSCLIKDSEKVKKIYIYNEIWDKFTNIIKIGFNKEPVYDEKI